MVHSGCSALHGVYPNWKKYIEYIYIYLKIVQFIMLSSNIGKRFSIIFTIAALQRLHHSKKLFVFVLLHVSWLECQLIRVTPKGATAGETHKKLKKNFMVPFDE